MAKGDIEGSIIYRDRASRELDKVAGSADKAGRKFGGLAKAGSVFGIVAGAAVLKFGKDSVKAFTEAQDSQAKLDQAYRKFPKTNDVNIASLRKLNSELARKTKFDDDALASGQAVLAQFNLSGKQIEQVTPLLADYAEKTGQDLPTAASLLGKALMGNAKALKAVGIQMPSAKAGADALAKAEDDVAKAEKKLADARKKGDPKKVAEATDGLAKAHRRLSTAQEGAAFTGDTFGRLMDGLKAKVGGTAETMGGTAAGKAEILKNQFGELEETAGQKLVPVLLKVADVGLKVVDFASRNSDVIGPLVMVVGTLVLGVKAWTMAQAALNTVMALNPIGLVVIAVAALAAGLIYAYKHSETFRNIVQGTFRVIGEAASFMWDKVLKPVFKMWFTVWSTVVGAIVHGAALAFGWVPGIGPKLKEAAAKFDDFRDAVNTSLNGIKDRKVAVEVIPTVKGAAFSGKTMNLPGMASGGTVTRAGASFVGENGPEILDLPVGARVTPLARAASAGGGTVIQLTVYFNGHVIDKRAAAQEIEGMLRDLERTRPLAFGKKAG